MHQYRITYKFKDSHAVLTQRVETAGNRDNAISTFYLIMPLEYPTDSIEILNVELVAHLTGQIDPIEGLDNPEPNPAKYIPNMYSFASQRPDNWTYPLAPFVFTPADIKLPVFDDDPDDDADSALSSRPFDYQTRSVTSHNQPDTDIDAE